MFDNDIDQAVEWLVDDESRNPLASSSSDQARRSASSSHKEANAEVDDDDDDATDDVNEVEEDEVIDLTAGHRSHLVDESPGPARAAHRIFHPDRSPRLSSARTARAYEPSNKLASPPIPAPTSSASVSPGATPSRNDKTPSFSGSRQSPIYVQDDDDDKTYYVGDVDPPAPQSVQQPSDQPTRAVYPGFGSFDPAVHHQNSAVGGAGSFGTFQAPSSSAPNQHSGAWPDLSFLNGKQP